MNNSGITMADFAKIVGNTINYYPEIISIQINPPVISGEMSVKSAKYDFLINFDDNGVITGNYSYESDDEVLHYVLNFADDVQEEVDYLLMNGKIRNKKRKTAHRRTLHTTVKCPNCGSNIGANAAKCSFCGYELRNQELSDSVVDFISQLEQCDSMIATSIPVSPGIGGNKSKNPNLSNEEKNKRDIILNYQFPNERNAILDAMMLVYRKMNILFDNKFKENKAVFWFNVWKIKAFELRKQQELLCVNDNEINGVFHGIEELIKVVEHRR